MEYVTFFSVLVAVIFLIKSGNLSSKAERLSREVELLTAETERLTKLFHVVIEMKDTYKTLAESHLASLKVDHANMQSVVKLLKKCRSGLSTNSKLTDEISATIEAEECEWPKSLDEPICDPCNTTD